MAEQFVEELYEYAKLPFLYKRCLEECYRKDMWAFPLIWKECNLVLDKLLKTLSEERYEDAKKLLTIAQKIASNATNLTLAGEIIEEELLPHLYSCLDFIGGIDVTEGKWHIFSSKTGFLTLQNLVTGEYLHSALDPMWEAWNYSRTIYQNDIKYVVLVGVGFGYLPYQIYMRSEKSAEIYIYEKDPQMVEFAKAYGVLDWIDPLKLHIIIEEDEYKLLDKFADTKVDHDYSRFFICDWMRTEFSKELSSNIIEFIENQKNLDRFRDRYAINYIQNADRFDCDIDKFYAPKDCDEYIIVAGGPSLSENIEFIKESAKTKKIIAVDAALKKLLAEDIIPDYVTILDPNPTVMHYIDGVESQTSNITLLAENTSFWKYLDSFKGPKVRVITTDSKWSVSYATQNGIERWQQVGTVSALAILEAIFFGAKKMYFVGLDLGYPGGKHHADGIGVDTSKTRTGDLAVKSVDGGMVDTTYTFVQFRERIEDIIANNPQVEFINMSKHGALIKGSRSHIC